MQKPENAKGFKKESNIENERPNYVSSIYNGTGKVKAEAKPTNVKQKSTPGEEKQVRQFTKPRSKSKNVHEDNKLDLEHLTQNFQKQRSKSIDRQWQTANAPSVPIIQQCSIDGRNDFGISILDKIKEAKLETFFPSSNNTSKNLKGAEAEKHGSKPSLNITEKALNKQASVLNKQPLRDPKNYEVKETSQQKTNLPSVEADKYKYNLATSQNKKGKIPSFKVSTRTDSGPTQPLSVEIIKDITPCGENGAGTCKLIIQNEGLCQPPKHTPVANSQQKLKAPTLKTACKEMTPIFITAGNGDRQPISNGTMCKKEHKPVNSNGCTLKSPVKQSTPSKACSSVESPPPAKKNSCKLAGSRTPPKKHSCNSDESSTPPKKSSCKSAESPPPPKKNSCNSVESPPSPKKNSCKLAGSPPPPKKNSCNSVEKSTPPKKNSCKSAESPPPPKKNSCKSAESSPPPKESPSPEKRKCNYENGGHETENGKSAYIPPSFCEENGRNDNGANNITKLHWLPEKKCPRKGEDRGLTRIREQSRTPECLTFGSEQPCHTCSEHNVSPVIKESTENAPSTQPEKPHSSPTKIKFANCSKTEKSSQRRKKTMCNNGQVHGNHKNGGKNGHCDEPYNGQVHGNHKNGGKNGHCDEPYNGQVHGNHKNGGKNGHCDEPYNGQVHGNHKNGGKNGHCDEPYNGQVHGNHKNGGKNGHCVVSNNGHAHRNHKNGGKNGHCGDKKLSPTRLRSSSSCSDISASVCKPMPIPSKSKSSTAHCAPEYSQKLPAKSQSQNQRPPCPPSYKEAACCQHVRRGNPCFFGRNRCRCVGRGRGCCGNRYCCRNDARGFFGTLQQAVGCQLTSIAFCNRHFNFPGKRQLYIPDHGMGKFLMEPDTYNSAQKKKKKKKKTETEDDEDDDTLMDTASAFNDRSFGTPPAQAPKQKTPTSSPKSPKRNRSPKSQENKGKASPQTASPPTKTKKVLSGPAASLETPAADTVPERNEHQEAKPEEMEAMEQGPSEVEASEDDEPDVTGVLSDVADRIDALKQVSVDTDEKEPQEKPNEVNELEQEAQKEVPAVEIDEEKHAEKEPEKKESREKNEGGGEQKGDENGIVETKIEETQTAEVIKHDCKNRVRKQVQRKCYELNTRVRSPREVMVVNLKEVCCQSRKTKCHARDDQEYEAWRAEDDHRQTDYRDPCSGSKLIKHRDHDYRVYLQRKKHAKEGDGPCEDWMSKELRKTKSPDEAVLSRKASSDRSRERRDRSDCKQSNTMQVSGQRKFANNETDESDSETYEDNYTEYSNSRSLEMASPGKSLDASIRKREKPSRDRHYERTKYSKNIQHKNDIFVDCSDSDFDSLSTTEHQLPKYKRIQSSSSYVSSLNDKYSTKGDDCSQLKQPSEFRFKYRLDSPRCNLNGEDFHPQERCTEESGTGRKSFDKKSICPHERRYNSSKQSSGRSDCSSVEVRITNSYSSCNQDKTQRYRDKRAKTCYRTNEEITNEDGHYEYLDTRSPKVSSERKRHFSQRRRKDCDCEEGNIRREDTLKGRRKVQGNEYKSFERPDKIYRRSKSSLGYSAERKRPSAGRVSKHTSESRPNSRGCCLEDVTINYTDAVYQRKHSDPGHRIAYKVNGLPSNDYEKEENNRRFITPSCHSSSPSSKCRTSPQKNNALYTSQSFCDNDLDISFEEAYTSSSVVQISNSDMKADLRHETNDKNKRISKETEHEEIEDGARDNDTAVHSSTSSLSDGIDHEGEESDGHRTVSISFRSRPSNSARDYSRTVSDNASLQDDQSDCFSSGSEYSSNISTPEQKRSGESEHSRASREQETVQRVQSGFDDNCVSSRSRLKGSIKIRGNKAQRCDSPECKNMTLCFSKGKLKVTSSPKAEVTNGCSECESYCSENVSPDSGCDKINQYKRYSYEDAQSRTLQKEMPSSKFNISNWRKKDNKLLDSYSPRSYSRCYNPYTPRTPSPGDCTSPKSEYLQKMMYSEHMQTVHGQIPREKSPLKCNELRRGLPHIIDKIVDRDKYSIAYRSRSNSAKRSINRSNENTGMDTFRQVITPEKVKVVNKKKQVSLHREESSDVSDEEERSFGNFSRAKVPHKSKSPPVRLRSVNGAFEHVSSFEEYFFAEECDKTPISSPHKHDMFMPEDEFYEDDENAQKALVRLSAYASWARNKNASSSVRKDLKSSSPERDSIYSASDYHRAHMDTVKGVRPKVLSSPEACESNTSEVTTSRSDSTILEGGDHGSLIQKVRSMTSLQAIGSLDEAFRQIRENSMRALMYASTMTDWATLSLLICSRFSNHEKEKDEGTQDTQQQFCRRCRSLEQIKVKSVTPKDQTAMKEFRKSCYDNSFTRVNHGNSRHKSWDYKKTRKDVMFSECQEYQQEAKPITPVVEIAHPSSCSWTKQSMYRKPPKINKDDSVLRQQYNSASMDRNDDLILSLERDCKQITTDDSFYKRTFNCEQNKRNRFYLASCNDLPSYFSAQDSLCFASRHFNNCCQCKYVDQIMKTGPFFHHKQYLERKENEIAASDERDNNISSMRRKLNDTYSTNNISNRISCFCKKQNSSSEIQSEANSWANETFKIFYENLSSNWKFSNKNPRHAEFTLMTEEEKTNSTKWNNDTDKNSTGAVENLAPATTHRSWFQLPKENTNPASSSEETSDYKSVFQKLRESISHEINIFGTAIGETMKSKKLVDGGHSLNERGSSVDIEASPNHYLGLEGEALSKMSTTEVCDVNSSKSPEEECYEQIVYPTTKRPRKRKKGTGARETTVGDKRERTSMFKEQRSSRFYFHRFPRDGKRKFRNKSTKKSKNTFKGRKKAKHKSNISSPEDTTNTEVPNFMPGCKENIHEGFAFSGISRIAKHLNFISDDITWNFDKSLCQADDETMNFEGEDLVNDLISSEESDKEHFDEVCVITDTDEQTQKVAKKDTTMNTTSEDKSSSDETSSLTDLKQLVNALKTMEHPCMEYSRKPLPTEINLSCKDRVCDYAENLQNISGHVMELFYPDMFAKDEETLMEQSDGFQTSEEECEKTASITDSTGGILLTTIKEESGDLGDSVDKKTVSSASTASLASLSKSNADQINPVSVSPFQDTSNDPGCRNRDVIATDESASTQACKTCHESEVSCKTKNSNLLDKLIYNEGLQCDWDKTNNLILSLSDTILLPKEKRSYLKEKKCANIKLPFQTVDYDSNKTSNSNPPIKQTYVNEPYGVFHFQASEHVNTRPFKTISYSTYTRRRNIRPFKSWFLREDLNSHLPPYFTPTSKTTRNDELLYMYPCEVNNSHRKIHNTNAYANCILLSPVSNDTSSSNGNNPYVSALDEILMSSNCNNYYHERECGRAAHHQYYLKTMTPSLPIICSLNFNYFKEDYKSDFLRTEYERENKLFERTENRRRNSHTFNKSTYSTKVRKLISVKDINFRRLQRDFLESNWNESANNTSGGSGSDVSSNDEDTSETDENSPFTECEGKCRCRPLHVSASRMPLESELLQPGCSKTMFNLKSWDTEHMRHSSCETRDYVNDIIDVDVETFAKSQFCTPKDVSQSNAAGLGVATFAKKNTNSSGNAFGRHMCADLQNDKRQIERYESKLTCTDSGKCNGMDFCSTTSKICHQSSDPGPIRHFDLGRTDTCEENCLFEHHDAPLFQQGAKGESFSMSAASNEMRPEISSFLAMGREPWVSCDCDSSGKCLPLKKEYCCCYQDALFGDDTQFQEQSKCAENQIYALDRSYFGQGDNCTGKPFIHWYVDDDVGGNCVGGNIEQFRSIPVSFKTFDDEDMKQSVEANIWALSSNGVLMHGEETSESESESLPSHIDDDEFDEDGNKSLKKDIRGSLDDTDSDDDKLDKEEHNEEDSRSNNSGESMFGDPMESGILGEDNKSNPCKIADSDMKTFKSCSEKHLNFTQNKITENRRNYDFGSNAVQAKNAISVGDKSNAKTQPLSPALSKTRKFSVDQLSVPTVEKERVRFACDENGEWAEIGRGSYGCVYLGLLDGSIEVAIKDFYESNSYDMVIHEARMLLFLQDTKIIPRFYGLRRRFDASKNPPEFCIIMEYFGDGRTLFNVMSDKISLCCEEWLDVLGQLVAGLRLIHCKDVLINDLKADNILIDLNSARKTIRYIDVGMATYRHGLTFQLPQEQMGKYNFLAPEVREGARTSTKSDIYSLGYLLEQMLQMAGCSLTGLSRLVSSCMEVRPEARPTADEIVGQVHRFIASRTVAGKWSGPKCVVAIKSV